MYELPTTITVEGVPYKIRNNGDFRIILDCFAALRDDTIGEDARFLASLIIFYEDLQDLSDVPHDENVQQQLITEMFKFMDGDKNSSTYKTSSASLVDWEGDSSIICAAINNVAHTEIRALPYLHWWTFLGYYLSIGQSVLSTVVNIRDKIVHGKKLEKWEREYRRDNPEYFMWRRQTTEEAEFDRKLREQFHGGAK